jgi:hypothetical protein
VNTILIPLAVSVLLASGEAASVSPDGKLEVELKPYPHPRSGSHIHPVVVRFTNRSNKTVRILRPLDGSEWLWHMPHYRFTVHDREGRQLDLGARCGLSGLWAELKWPEDYVLQILPGDSYEMQVGIPHAIPSDGEYRVRFDYIFRYEDKSTNDGFEYPPGLWEGTASSKEVVLTLKGDVD